MENSDGKIIQRRVNGNKKRDQNHKEENDKIKKIPDTKEPIAPSKLRNFITRTIFTILLLGFLLVLIFGGFIIDYILLFGIIFQCYREIIRVGYSEYKQCFPLFRSLGWYFFIAAIYYATGNLLVSYFSYFIGSDIQMFFTDYHQIITFFAFIFGIIVFVLTLRKNHMRKQFGLLAWFNLSSLFLSLAFYGIFKNMQVGLIWVFLPMSLIIINDIFAYLFGMAIGKTPLIKLSPKKTWEGFLGAFGATLVFSLILCQIMIRFPYFYCPYDISKESHPYDIKCEIPNYMKTHIYSFPLFVRQLTNYKLEYFQYIPIHVHSIVIALFVSFIAPFGGFLASGFKRAFKIKDFGDAIPGHGGMLDRMDCQFILSVFAYVYIYTFIQTEKPDKLLSHILKLNPSEQLEMYEQLKHALSSSGLLGQTLH